ncbi:hypothetical protein L228DRAFT_42631 [Xylona heveae TC161]|uniref:Uncharacterized protein n=1 Tax=Xylona heveae (strain CBS 132557 / TC161) TaxID=1328760 RepID=A0A164ZQU7_XYLHT|nr:hypothetical protein L228DRAFT_42631 [Xylona heveae TC161]KZF19393.1 hypothetical protein L228DRAFT_42631 [Xylona heveae TC161]
MTEMDTGEEASNTIFDEEACRDFLTLELGCEIPRYYRYAEGIHEVQKRLILCYGDNYIAEAMGVFYDLLEGEDNASGLGDDGDFWRTWRHDFKLRREDFSNPGTPKFSKMILPATVEPKRRTSLSRAPGNYERGQKRVSFLTPKATTQLIADSNNSTSKIATANTDHSTAGSANPVFMAFPSTFLRIFQKDRKQKGQLGTIHSDDINRGRRLRGMSAPERVYSSHAAGESARHDGREHVACGSSRKSDDPPPPYPAINSFDGAGDHWDESMRARGGPVGRSDSFDKEKSSASQRLSSSELHNSSSTYVSSSYLSSRSSKQDSQSAARNLLGTNTEGQDSVSARGLSPLDPEKYSPAPYAGRMPDIQSLNIQYMSPPRTGPFDVRSGERWRMIPEENPSWAAPDHWVDAKEDIQRSYHATKGMIKSRSDGAMISPYPPMQAVPNQGHQQRTRTDGFSEEELRGRPAQRSSSRKVAQLLGDIDEIPHLERKRSRSPIKKIFGENGWLGRSKSMKDFAHEKDGRKSLKQLSGKIKQRVDEIAEEMIHLIPNPFHPDGSSKREYVSKFPVSLDPPTQAKLYSEIELMICATANTYLIKQNQECRMSVESLRRVIEYWRSKGRPQVIEFQFDQATQRDLILYNIKTFRFFGERAENPVALNAMMHTWKTVAKEMAVRTFCNPDSVVRKHLHDIHLTLEFLGAPAVTFLAFQDMQLEALRAMNEAQKARENNRFQQGVEKVWIPPVELFSRPENPELRPGHGR